MKKWTECKCGNFFKKTVNLVQCESCSDVNMDEYYFEKTVDRLSNIYIDMLPEVNNDYPRIKNNFSVQIDHIVPKWVAIKHGISVYEIAGVDNMHITSVRDNFNNKGMRLPEKWFSWLTGKDWVYRVGDVESIWLHEVCTKTGLSYVKAASQIIKKPFTEIVVDGVKIEMIDPNL